MNAAADLTQYQRLIRSRFTAVLASNSIVMPGYPAAAALPYALDHHDKPLVFISRLAQHSRNLRADNKVSMSIWSAEDSKLQTQARLNLLANAHIEHDQVSLNRYLNHYPEAKDYLQLDFELYRLEPIRVHFIAGFAQVYWLDAKQLPNSQTDAKFELRGLSKLQPVVNELSNKLCRRFNINTSGPAFTAIGLTDTGLTLRADKQLIHLQFDDILLDYNTMAQQLRDWSAQ